MYRTVTFAYSGDVEWEFDAQDRLVAPGGKALAVSIAEALRDSGARVSEVESHEDFGWAFESESAHGAFFQVVNAVEDKVYLTIQSDAWRAKRGSRTDFEQHCQRIGAALSTTPGVAEIHWDEYRS